VTGNKPRRGLADFLSRELKAQPALRNDEVRTPVTDRVAEPEAPKAPPRVELVTAVAPGPATASQGAVEVRPEAPPAAPSATTSQTREIRKIESDRVPDPVTPTAPVEVVEAPKAGTDRVRETVRAEVPRVVATAPRVAEVPKDQTDRVDDAEAGAVDDPLYLRLTRKEVRFRDDQMEGLHRVARRLSKARRGMKGDRITDNTLVRVAVELLLQHGDDLAGHDEATLLESLRRLCRKRG
jgi:hypothetical protein